MTSASFSSKVFYPRRPKLSSPSSDHIESDSENELESDFDSPPTSLRLKSRLSPRTKFAYKHLLANRPLACHNHATLLPSSSYPSIPSHKHEVIPCDYVRSCNPNKFNNMSIEKTQCRTPKCETCVQVETYGPLSVWYKTAPEGMTAEAHRFHSRVRYLCSVCPPPPRPPKALPDETCSCSLYKPGSAGGEKTDMYFQCQACSHSQWFDHDVKFGSSRGGVRLVNFNRVRRRGRDGVYTRRRAGRWGVRMVVRCACGRFVKRGERGVGKGGSWCTWCGCPVTEEGENESGNDEEGEK